MIVSSGLSRKYTQVDGGSPSGFIVRVALIEPLEQAQPDVNRVESPTAISAHVVAVGSGGDVFGQQPGLKNRFPKPIDDVVNKREAAMGKAALIGDLQPGILHCFPELVAGVQPDVIGPDARQKTVLDMRLEHGLQCLVDRVPSEGVVGVRHRDGEQPARLEHSRHRAQGLHIIIDVLQDFGEDGFVEGFGWEW